MTPEKATEFIRDTLGCQCPPELFEDLRQETELSRGPLYAAFKRENTEIIPLVDRIFSVGGRLLVAVGLLWSSAKADNFALGGTRGL